jgi:hypothetical protein
MDSVILLVGLVILGLLSMVYRAYWISSLAMKSQRGGGTQFNIFMILLLFNIIFAIYTILYKHGDRYWLIHKM